jgi:hypothetical protein
MATKLSRDSIRLDIKNDNCAVNSSRSKEVALAVEADTGRMATAKAGSGGLGVVLGEHEGIGEREIHFATYDVSAWCLELCLRRS